MLALLAHGRAIAQSAPAPVSASFSTILDARSSELSVWRLADNPRVHIFDFPGLRRQGRTFNRVTQFTEQQQSEPYPRVLNNEELAAYQRSIRRTDADMAFGHDLLVQELVQFFNYAQRDRIELNPEELLLKDYLIAQNLIRVWRGFFQAVSPGEVILSIPQAQERSAGEPRITRDARFTILLHEVAHAEFYTNKYYADHCYRFWSDVLTQEQRDAFKAFLAKYNYNAAAEALLVNEAQAYLMFTPDPASFSAAKLGVSEEELAKLRNAFLKGMPGISVPTDWMKGAAG